MAVQACVKSNMLDDDDDEPLVFKRSTASKQNQLNSEIKKSLSQKNAGSSGRQVPDVQSPNGQRTSSQKGKTVPSAKPLGVKPSMASPEASTSSAKASAKPSGVKSFMASPEVSTSSAKTSAKPSGVKSSTASPEVSSLSANASPVKSPLTNSKGLPSSANQLNHSSKQNSSIVVKEEKHSVKHPDEPNSDSEDSEDDKPLSVRISAGLSKGSSNHANKGLSTNNPHPSQSQKPKVNIKKEESDDDDEMPLSSRFAKSSAGTSASKSSMSDEKKPMASKLQQNGSTMRDDQRKSPPVFNKRPLDKVSSSGQSSVKKPKLSGASQPIKNNQVSIKAEPKAEDDDHVPIAQRIKKSASSDGKSLSANQKATKVVSSSFKKTTKSSKKVVKTTKYSKSTKMQPSSGEGQKWTTLVHNGVIFPPPYKPHGVKMLYKGKPVDLTPEQEEVATMFAVMIDTDYAKKEKFIENFMTDWKKILGKNHVIQKFEDCDFRPIYEWHQAEKEKKKQISKEEKKAMKEDKMKQEEKYMWAVLDGVKEKVGNFRVEPPGLFRGRGEHPKMGKLKRRIRPSDITINIGKGAPIPECPIPGERWREVRHDNTVTWLAFWNDPINPKEFKYVFLAASSSLKGQSDKEKYEKSRTLKNYIEGIRTAYTRDFTNKDVTKRQIAVATYLIDKLALRAGNEKDDDEADTVGCCTLKVENVTLVPPNKLEFDFLGKDSIRYNNVVEVEVPVYKAIGEFQKGKRGSDDLFDELDTSKLNTHLKELMPGLTAKVFRTYNASITLDEMLSRDTKDGDVPEKIVVYNAANKEVAIICNHQRTISKSHAAQMTRLTEKMNELKGSDYFRFGMRDSLAIEASFLQREEELLSSWWKEYAECSEGPRERPSSSTNLDPLLKASSLEGVRSALYAAEEERVGVPVKGGLYEVDLVKRHCFPVYWIGENRRVLRGHWFARKGGLDWLPLREDVAEQLEFAYRSQVWHRRTFQASGLFAARVDLQGSTPGLHALFTGEDDTWEAWLNVDASGFSGVISLSRKGIKLRRGYSASQSPKPTQDELRQRKEEEIDDYCSQVPVRHVVFMVHGIGQRLEKSNLVDDVGNFHHITASLAERHLTSYQRDAQRVLYIPCQWRRGLKLSGETAVEKITLDGVRGLRVMLSATVHDVLYYMSPIYCQDIINSVSNQLNRLYLKFLKRNPGYDGMVSLYGHSLGSVLTYDILCHQENLSSPFPMDWMYKEHSWNEESPVNMNAYSSIRNSSVADETMGTLVSIDEAKTAKPILSVHEEDHAEDSCVADPVTLDSDEFSSRITDLNQLNAKIDVHESVCNSSDVFPQVKDGLDEAASINYGVSVAGSEMPEEVHEDTSDKEKVINSLKKEIDFLKARITELKLQSSEENTSGGGNKQPMKPISDKLPLGQEDTHVNYTPYIKYTKLEFKVDTFFAVGSPLGVFLALRNVRIGIGKGQEYWGEENITEEMPACRQMFNIFHPFDPVAYRIEPLVCKEYISKRPVIIPYYKGGKRLHIGIQDFAEDLASRSQAIMDHLSVVRAKVLTVCQSRHSDSEEAPEISQDKEERTYGSIMMERLTGSKDGRVDHMLQDKTFEHAYISAIGAHTNYWRDYDTALFILKHLYRHIPEEPYTGREFDGNISKNESDYTGWGEERGAIDEELPLTFSDKVTRKSFSKKEKKIVKKP